MRSIRLVLPLLAVIVALLAAAPSAAANTYVVYTCKTPLGARAPVDGFSVQSTAWDAVNRNDCASGGSLVGALPGGVTQAHGARATWRFTAPADTTIKQFDMWHWAAAISHPDDGMHEVEAYASWPGGEPSDAKAWCNSNICAQRNVQTNQIDSRNVLWSGVLDGVRTVSFGAACIGADRAPCAARGTGGRYAAEWHVQGMRWTLTDDHLPAVSAVAGDLVEGGPHEGTEGLTFDATDKGSGVFRVLVELKAADADEFSSVLVKTVDDNGGRCNRLVDSEWMIYEWGYTVPCALATSGEVDWNTASLPDGDYRLRVRVEDAAGNSTTAVASRDFVIDNVPPPAAKVPPKVIGLVQKGANVLGNRGEWNAPGLTFTDAWLRCADATSLASCEPIPGATSESYRVVTEDIGRYLRFRVTASSSDGTGTAVSDASSRATTAAGAVPQCADGIDNDKDGKVDTDDPACPSRENTDEAAETIPSGPFTPMPTATPTPAPSSSPPVGGGGGGPGNTPSRGEPNGSNASDRARFVIGGGNQRRLAHGRGAVANVALRDENGRPIGNATVLVLERMSVPGARWIPAHSPLTTDADGRIRYAIEPRYSRKLRFAYRSHRSDQAFAATRELTVTVKSRTSLTTNRSYLRNGDAVLFKGRLASRPVPRNGIVIDLQAQVGRRWQTFQTLRTSRDGRWKARYRFRSTSGLQTYTFRARVRGDSGYPYSPSTSRKVKVRVRG